MSRLIVLYLSSGYNEEQEILESMLDEANSRGDTSVTVLINKKVEDEDEPS